jgi:hypothetical protein
LVDTEEREIPSYKIVEQMQQELLLALKTKYAFISDISSFTIQA